MKPTQLVHSICSGLGLAGSLRCNKKRDPLNFGAEE